MTTKPAGRRNGVSVVWNADGDPEVRLRKDIGTANHDPRADLEAEMDPYEKLRLLYVACTRARDHLVVAAHHQEDDRSYACTVWKTIQDQFDTWRVLPDEQDEGPAARPVTVAAAPAAPPSDDREAWLAAREALLAPQPPVTVRLGHHHRQGGRRRRRRRGARPRRPRRPRRTGRPHR